MAGLLSIFHQNIAEFVIRRKRKNLDRHRMVINLEEAVTICILYKVTSEKLFNSIRDLTKVLTAERKQVLAFGYVDRKEIPNYCVAANAGYYFCQKDLNWFGGPKSDYLKKFIDKEFDLLIDLTLEDVFINRYLATLSRSKFKVGKHSDLNLQHLDMVIKMDKKAREEDYILQILHYLKTLRRK